MIGLMGKTWKSRKFIDHGIHILLYRISHTFYHPPFGHAFQFMIQGSSFLRSVYISQHGGPERTLPKNSTILLGLDWNRLETLRKAQYVHQSCTVPVFWAAFQRSIPATIIISVPFPLIKISAVKGVKTVALPLSLQTLL